MSPTRPILTSLGKMLPSTRSIVLLAALLLSAPHHVHAATFEEQRSAVAASLETQSEQAILDLLTAGIEENRPAPAVALASEWLRRNLPKNPVLLFLAARASELSGETKNAVSFHQQALKLADPQSPEAGESITAIHTLLIHRLDDPAGAYAFAQNEAGKLIVNPRFRQFDRWFLDQAKTRNDRSALASRLLATLKAGTSQDLLALHDTDLKWLLDSIRAVRYDQKPDRFTADFTSTVKALAGAIAFDEEYRLLLDWSVSVKAYNMAKIDGQDAKAPHAEAKALLDKSPRHAALVQTDWAGGSNSRHYRDEPKKYWSHETEAKLAPIRAALTQLAPLDQADLLRTWSSQYYDSGPQVITPAEVPAFILANKDLVNRRTGPIFTFELDKITPAQAAELAPHLALNPSPEASVVRALAAAGETKNLDNAIAAFLGPEAWRLDRAEFDGRFADRLWHMTGRPGDVAKREEVIAKSKALAATIPAQDEENQFTPLLNDFLSPAPITPGLRARLTTLINDSPDLIPAALADARPETQLLVRDAILADLGNPNGALKIKANKKRNKIPKPVDSHPLEPDLRNALSDSLTRNQLESWLVSSWVRTLNANQTAESIQLAESILKSPAFPALSHEARQEFLVKSLIDWAGEANSPLTPAEKATIELAYGDIALQRGQVRQAHEIYTRTRENPAYAGLPIRHEASLRRVRAERISKNYDAALQTLTDLELERVPEIWTEVRFARAEVYFDREDFDDAKDDVDSILARDPNHADSRILLGKIQLKRQKLMEATEVELGSSSGQKTLVPGERLKVTLSDPTLAVSGAGTEIEVVVWATSGDKETFFLRQFGDEKTKFRGEVATALGAPNPGDSTLQVIGADEVFYAYSERFREKMNNIDEKRGGPIAIASDALLMASARKLLTEAEQRSADMQIVMEEIGAGANSEAAAKARIATGEVTLDHDRHIATIVKPGNPVHVRVSDPDRGRTAEIDELTVSAGASSGDSVSRITLKETATHSGIFEGIIPTTGAQASAFAQNSEPGRAPNMVISPLTNYPAWRPVPIKGATPDFTVDLNDNLPLGELIITAREPGTALKKFIVQTAMNPADWTSVGTFPASKISLTEPGKPSVTVVNEEPSKAHYGARSVYEMDALRSHMATGWLALPDMAIAKNVTGVSTALPASIPTDIKWSRGPYPNPAVVVRFQAYFHEKEDVTRRFALDLGKSPDLKISADDKQKAQPAEFLIAVNGKVITTKDQPQLQGEINLSPGIHKIEIFATGWLSNIGFGRELKLRANLIDPEDLVVCPDTYFDPATFPPSLIDHRNAAATSLTANADSTEFTVKFAGESRARLIRLLLVESDGTAPALNKLTLTKPDGAKILPVANDFADLNKNETLEILTGDKVSVRYVDDRFVTKARERHERFLDVSFTDARAEFADMEPRFDSRHNEDRPYYEKLIRFLHGKPLNLAIHDADMDATVAPDKVKVSLETTSGTKEYEATETGDSTGIFKLTVTPVSGTPKNEGEIQVPDAGAITARYMDRENNRPGVPTPRVAIIRHAAFTEPQIRLSHATVTPIEGQGTAAALHHGFERLIDDKPDATSEAIRASWQVNQALLPTAHEPEGGFQSVLGQQLYLEIRAPQMALGTASQIEVFAQTGQGRAVAGSTAEGFDKNVPGTLLLEATLYAFRSNDTWRGVPILPIYQVNAAPGFGENPELDRFFITVPLILGILPEVGAMTFQERYELAKTMRESLDDSQSIDLNPDGLVVRPGENVHIGFRYTAPDGSEKWATATTKVVTHPAFDLMSVDHRETMSAAYVGEDLNLRVVDPGADLTDAADTVKVLVQAKSGAKHTVELHESGTHTGIFKGSYQLAYAGATSAPEPPPAGTAPAAYDVRVSGFPVTYGDTVAARYTDANGIKTATRMVSISKGADGTIEPFSKTYDDPAIAMRTQFSLAEAYLEVAKRRRKLGENEAADLDYNTAKQLLSGAMDQFNDPATRAHAEYLLGSLTMEEAESTDDAETKETRYRAALSRFINITGSYSQTVHAAKAQYQIATIYERLKEPDIAAQEYVKLAYKYPDSEHLAVSMARLGTHFLKKAAEYEAKAKPLLEKAEADKENKDAAFEGEAMNKMAVAEYLKTARIFGRLQERFPTDPLAGQAGLRAGQSFMRASKHQEAVDAFKRVIAESSYDGKTIRAQAMYWSGMSYQALKQPMAAYSHFKRLTYDFPESEWAAFARGQLSQEGMLNLEDKLELERLESER